LGLVLAVLGVSVFFLVRRNPFGVRTPLQRQARLTAVGFVVAGVVSAVCVVASLLLVEQHLQDLVQSVIGPGLGSSLSNLFHVSVTWAIGVYLFLAGLVVIVVAGVMEAIAPVRMQSDPEVVVTLTSPQNPYADPSPMYGSAPMNQGGAPFANSPTQYGGTPMSGGQPYPSAPGPQPPAGPYQQ
jgi:hypothetical protein